MESSVTGNLSPQCHSIIFVLVWVLAIACGKSTSEQSAPGVSPGQVKTTSTSDQSQIDPANAPAFRFETQKVELGSVAQDTTITVTYQFKNVGKSPLIINKVHSSCTCTVGSYPKEPVLPGEGGSVDLVYKSRGKRGKQRVVAVLLSNAQTRYDKLVLNLSVRP